MIVRLNRVSSAPAACQRSRYFDYTIMLNRILLALSLTCLTGFAQNGDKVGEKQEAPIPADKIPPAPPLTPEEALGKFRLPPDFEIQIVASEPMIQNPVIAQWDAAGRLWVLEMRSYMLTPDGKGELSPISQAAILEDTNGDGRMDRKKVFLDNLVMPRAMAFAQDGVLICEPPQLWFYPILPGDKPGKRVLVDADYARAAAPKNGHMNVEHAENGLTRMLDNWYYSAKSASRYRKIDEDWKKLPTNFKGQWGIAQDDYGRIAYNSNSDHFRMEPIPSEYFLRNPFHRNANFDIQPLRSQETWPGRINPGINRGYRKGFLRPDGTLARFTGASGVAIYRGSHFPPEFSGDAFVSEPTGNFVRRDDVTEKDGNLSATNPYAKAKTEFLTSTDEIFRPVNTFMGPDGALYIVDMYHGIIQHRVFLTSYLRQQSESRGLDKVVNYGRIYRVVHKGRPLDKGPDLSKANSRELVAALSHPNGWYRDTAQRLLVDRAPGSAIVPLQQAAVQAKSHLGRIHALWTLSGLGYIDLPILQTVFKTEKHPKVLATAIRLSDPLIGTWQKDDAVALITKSLTGAGREVLLQAALTLSGADSPVATAALVEIARERAGDRAFRDAIVSGLAGREAGFISALVADTKFGSQSKDRELLLGDLSRCVIIQSRRDPVNEVLDIVANPKTPSWQKTALIVGMTPITIKATKGLPPIRRKLIRLEEEPRALASLKTIETRAIRNAVDKLDDVLVWPGKPGVKPEPPVRQLSASEAARYQAGKELYTTTCGGCHQPHGFGMPGMAPPLADSEWVAGSADNLIRIVLHGISGRITVLGQTYNLDMPGHGTFTDNQVSEVLTYIRREWDHPYDPVDPKRVTAIRQQSGERADAWTMDELLSIK